MFLIEALNLIVLNAIEELGSQVLSVEGIHTARLLRALTLLSEDSPK